MIFTMIIYIIYLLYIQTYYSIMLYIQLFIYIQLFFADIFKITRHVFKIIVLTYKINCILSIKNYNDFYILIALIIYRNKIYVIYICNNNNIM